jgi:aminoglycoside phosphotransferase (APT) family kinase protein
VLELMPHGYTNRTVQDGQVVAKSYQGPGAAQRCAREAAVLAALAGQLPVPPLLGHGDGQLRMGLMAGVPGQDLVDAGLAEQVLGACGRMLRQIHAIGPEVVLGGDGRPRPGMVLVHGDYGPNNVLLDAEAREVTAVVDWEWAHVGTPVQDLAWCEWIVRMHHPACAGALGALFGAYGHRPAWAARQLAMTGRCQYYLGLWQRWEPGGDAVRQWRKRLAVTRSWTERTGG